MVVRQAKNSYKWLGKARLPQALDSLKAASSKALDLDDVQCSLSDIDDDGDEGSPPATGGGGASGFGGVGGGAGRPRRGGGAPLARAAEGTGGARSP